LSDTSPTLTVRMLFNALHSEWRLLCNSEVHALCVVAAEGLSVASVARYLSSPGASVVSVVSPPTSIARVVMPSPVAPQTVGSNWPRQKVARLPGAKPPCGRIPTGERNLLNSSHFRFRARHSTTLQCMRLVDHMTLNFNNNICLQLRYSWISKKPLTLHGTLACSISYLNYNFRPV
jgi:hypothetical protein